MTRNQFEAGYVSRGPFSPTNCSFFKSKRYLIAVDFFFSYVYVGSAAFSVGAIKLFFYSNDEKDFLWPADKSSSLKIK